MGVCWPGATPCHHALLLITTNHCNNYEITDFKVRRKRTLTDVMVRKTVFQVQAMFSLTSDYKPLHNFPLFLSASTDTHPHTKSPTLFLFSMSEQICFLSQFFSGIIFSERLLMQVSAFLYMAFLPHCFSISAYICIHIYIDIHIYVCVCVCACMTI